MRYTPTLKLSTRLVAFVTVIVTSAMFILFLGGTLSFKRLGQEYLDHSLQGIVEVLDKEMEDPDAAYSLQRWMPKMLQASNIVEMKLLSDNGVIYRYKDTSSKVDKALLYDVEYQLERNVGYRLQFKAVPPYIGYGYSLEALWSITLAVALIIFCLMRGVKWLREQLAGSELLEERGRMILAGRVEEYAKGDVKEWPYTASEALDCLIEELQDARQERSRFDTFIRTQTFLDQLTGTANRVLFDSKLEAALSEHGSHGGVLLLRIDDWDQLQEESGKSVADDFVVDIGENLNNIIQRYPDVILSRYYESDFAIFAPHLSSKDISQIAVNSLKQLTKLSPPSPLDKENWVHIGISMYREGESQGRILDEVETALKSAQLQRVNTWNKFNKLVTHEDERGSVRWRTLFDLVLKPEKLYIYHQPCYLLDSHRDRIFEHSELFVRINDPDKGLIKASRFNSAIESVGYESILDRAVFSTVVKFLKVSKKRICYSVNLHVVPFSERDYLKWFRYELLQLTAEQRKLLIFEFAEARLVKHLDYMRPVIKMISGLGCRVSVGQAGRSIVSTHYLKDLPVDFLKLHRSLVKQIDQRDENQLFVRSLLGACEGLKTQVIAVGVDNKQEYKTMLALGVQGVQGRYFQSEQQLLPEVETEKKVMATTKVQIGRRNRWRKVSSK
ncbi:diguanylate phosphodiesterase [Vibrio coralliilyticus]|uniref:Diguanylate phosphodiesterase n=2 Tax=Vibrio coralliilyticus TaxID=190893 RepID=A0A097AV28_9VIBR|nr:MULTISPECIES: RNase E specificity factor CsrD [Vibrio]AIS53708.1 diguanylate phosphodiesterase [Vibrio coralliilyticus]AIW20007.1 diguanylate phosphodiesterase [Vibrio coralliilyticus]ANW24648.1 RNase E specificity factor CsrD [Vibrio coralliilyticus]ARC93209.1 RNase E specificity factor CsrD [Vibrio coralliilyticus]AXN31678.1 RNase E specificity factor CsrD [Vibrio coralliilyticus]